MPSSALKVPEKTARRLLKELNHDNAASMTTKKLEKELLGLSLNGESVEDMDLSDPCKSLLEEVVEANDEERPVKIVAAQVEETEADDEEAPAKKRGRKPATKTKTKVKAKPEKTKVKKTKTKTKSSGDSKYDPEKGATYQEKLRKEGVRIEKAIASGAKSVATLAEKAGVTESRINSFMNYYNRNRKTPVYEIRKGKVYSNKE